MDTSLNERIRNLAIKIGFDLVGFTSAKPSPYSKYLRKWLKAGYEGEMAYMRRNVDKREDPQKLEPWAKSIITVAVNYNSKEPYSTDPRPTHHGWIARYAWGDDYHDHIKSMLFKLADAVRKLDVSGGKTKVCVDTAPVLERVYSQQSGLGWYGKNTCIINRSLGSFLLLGEVLTELALDENTPEPDHCGTCTACIEACPTDAILEPYVLDSRRCISYLTIEHRGTIPEELRDKMGTHVFGCDICQDVCPWNRKSERCDRAEYHPRPGNRAPSIAGILEMTRKEYQERFRHSPVKRAKYDGLLRNAAIAAGNSNEPSLLSSLEKAAKVSPIVKEHAEWAIQRLKVRSQRLEVRGQRSEEKTSNIERPTENVQLKTSLVEMLGISRGAFIAVVGAGGKSTLLHHLACESVRRGYRVLTSSTTNLQPPLSDELGRYVFSDDKEVLLKKLQEGFKIHRHMTAAMTNVRKDKIKGLPPEVFEELHLSKVADVILIQADGARKRSFKAPGEHEPVIPSGATHCILVVGMDALNQRLDSKTVHRVEITAELAQQELGSLITHETIFRVVTHPNAYLSHFPKEAKRILYLSKTDTLERQKAAKELAEAISPNLYSQVLWGNLVSERAIL